MGNLLIAQAAHVPGLEARIRRQPAYYQVNAGEALGDDRQGVSLNKWKAMQMPSSLAGKSVLDIGCADGFFCEMCARSSARRVVGMDSALGRLLRARFAALGRNLDIVYRLDIFPSPSLKEQFDYVFCLSVLHHFLTHKDFWKVLNDADKSEDLALLRRNLGALLALTAPGGSCVIEMPYEYDEPSERAQVDFGRFAAELMRAGFAGARCLGDWEYNPKHKQMKDRMIYVATA
jgi:SAM-dependent methyltransferase